MPEVLAALPRLKDKLSPFITHRFRFDDVLEGFKAAADPMSTKVMIEFDEAHA
jgi:threonine dehydrogenase-like Zn-dependent dehydrogenase